MSYTYTFNNFQKFKNLLKAYDEFLDKSHEQMSTFARRHKRGHFFSLFTITVTLLHRSSTILTGMAVCDNINGISYEI